MRVLQTNRPLVVGSPHFARWGRAILVWANDLGRICYFAILYVCRVYATGVLFATRRLDGHFSLAVWILRGFFVSGLLVIWLP